MKTGPKQGKATSAQVAYLAAHERLSRKHDRAPTIRELADDLSVTTRSVGAMLVKLDLPLTRIPRGRPFASARKNALREIAAPSKREMPTIKVSATQLDVAKAIHEVIAPLISATAFVLAMNDASLPGMQDLKAAFQGAAKGR